MWKRNAPYLYVGYCCSDHADMMSSCLMLLNGRVWRCSGCPDVSCRHFACISVLVEATRSMWSRRCICRHTLRRESKTISCKWPSNSPSQTVSLTCGSMITTAVVLFSPPLSRTANAGYTGMRGKVTEIVRINHDGEINKCLS